MSLCIKGERMEKFSKEYFKMLANQIMLDLSDTEIEELQDEFKTLTKQMELLEKIDTNNVEAMIYPFEEDTYYLRKDEVSNVITKEEALLNAPDTLNDQVIVPKVVK